MTAAPCPCDTSPTPSDAHSVPFAGSFVTLTKQEHIELVMQANGWKSLHQRAVERSRWRDQRYRRVLRQIKEQAAQREAMLRAELELAQAKVPDLQQRMLGRKSERRKGGSEQQAHGLTLRIPRGHKRGAPGHGRTMLAHLPQRIELVEIDTPQCPQCGLELSVFPGTEDSEVLEIEVQAYRRVGRVIRRRRYRPTCDCGCVPGIVAAPAPPRLIERGKFGVSVWTSVLLDQVSLAPARVTVCCTIWATMGSRCRRARWPGVWPRWHRCSSRWIAALVGKLRSESHWHADETRWAVFVELGGKVGHRWTLWVFHSSSVVHYVLDESRSAEVLEGELAGVQRGVISCDRYSAYKKFARFATPGSCSHSVGLSGDINRPVDDLCLTKGWPSGPARPARPSETRSAGAGQLLS